MGAEGDTIKEVQQIAFLWRKRAWGHTSSTYLPVVQKIRIGILRFGGIQKNKIYGSFRSRVIDGRKHGFNSSTLRAVNFLWKRSTGRVNANSPRVIVDGHWRQ
jgi:hypothetical protein